MDGYTVESMNNRVVIRGPLPIDDLVALQKAWKKRGLDTFDASIASALGATMAICRKGDEEAWRKDVAESAARRADGDAELEWLLGPDTGVSSKSIFSVLAASELLRKRARASLSWGADVPHDPDDFGRCYRLLEKFPAWQVRLSEVAAVYPKYGPMVREWERMGNLWRKELPTGRCPNLYDLMRKLEAAGEREMKQRKGGKEPK